ncbi:esterase [Enterobacillus tribolii]|uniref:Phospholipase/carboxylesterase n=1 Tax=Enterobacillus tribolii TaxID=1487935 RepID=A0A370QRV4_9GAMM|nr:esterase [Enterobacillus tribolii]MBW7983508.1 esterase [Enterobacillus tribolii]RDK91994.1 phospholipase/carboxylesterase [Enterobacillus tribolii]
MKHEHHVVQSPATPPQQLFLLFHGVGDNPVSMGQIGEFFASAFPQALVISIGSPHLIPSGLGLQWFSVEGVTEENRAERVAAEIPHFVEIVRYWQKQTGIAPDATALVGFSQGAIMALEAAKAEAHLAGRIVAFSGRFAALPEHAFDRTVVHLIHGSDDKVINVKHAEQAAESLRRNGSDYTIDIEPVGHGISEAMIDLALERLRAYVPQRYWDEALSGKRGEIIAFK